MTAEAERMLHKLRVSILTSCHAKTYSSRSLIKIPDSSFLLVVLGHGLTAGQQANECDLYVYSLCSLFRFTASMLKLEISCLSDHPKMPRCLDLVNK